jgi:hypothetical protein
MQWISEKLVMLKQKKPYVYSLKTYCEISVLRRNNMIPYFYLINNKFIQMKKTITISLFFGSLFAFCNFTSKNKDYKKLPAHIHLIDSLQGKWRSESDSNEIIIINGINCYNLYQEDSTLSITLSSKLYFSDTLFPTILGDDTYKQISTNIDTSKKDGKYLIFSSAADSTILCYKFHAIN